MHFVTQEFLTTLASDGPGMDDEGRPSITDIWVDEENPHLDIEVLSDLHIDGPEPQRGGAYSADEAKRLRISFVERYRRLRKAFDASGRATGKADLLVMCGDLIAGRRDVGPLELRRAESTYSDICRPALESLQEPDRARNADPGGGRLFPQLLTIPGNEDAYGGGGEARGRWPTPLADTSTKMYPYYSHLAASLALNRMPERPEVHPVAAIFRVLQRGHQAVSAAYPGVAPAPLAYVAVIGFDSNDMGYKHDLVRNYGQISAEQLQWSRRLVSTLRSGRAQDAPFYVINLTHHNLLPDEDHVVHAPQGEEDERVRELRERLQLTSAKPVCEPFSNVCIINHFIAANLVGSTSNVSGFLKHCKQLRTSLVVQGSMPQRSATTLRTVPLIPGEPVAELTVVAAPEFATERPTSGMARIRLDLWRGEAQIAFHYDQSFDDRPSKPIQINRPLISASRISAAERRLYSEISQLVAKALDKGTAARDPGAVQKYADYVSNVWKTEGYASVSLPDGTLPYLGDPTRQNRYFLLLLLRETEGNNYEIMLSRHNPLRPSSIAEWDTLLMPAFSSVRNLMERLHLDVVRQAVAQAEDMEKATSAQMFEAAIERIERGGGNVEDDIWQDKIREVGTTNSIKISPTTGQITDYEYRLVVLTPFMRGEASDDPGRATNDQQRRELEDERRVVRWLNELPSMRLPGAPIESRQTLPLEAVMTGGAGLRWEPAVDPDDPRQLTRDEDKRRAILPPGSVWFPLPETDELTAPWAKVPSIVARNADVMHWVHRVLTRQRYDDGSFPPHLVMEKMREEVGYALKEGPFPFEPDPRFATSTRQAMDQVEYISTHDLQGQQPYLGLEYKRVALVRRTVTVPSGRERDVIMVFDATDVTGAGRGLTAFKTCDPGSDPRLLGVLRPAQRYVLESGLERAEWVNSFLETELEDPWGFLRATFGGLGDPIALTPPIIERVHPDDVDSDDESRHEFLVCDGNHRVVQKVWEGRSVAAAIAVVAPPRNPYYARPFSPYEWDVTADNRLPVTPQPRFRHAPRRVDPVELGLSEEDLKILRRFPPDQWYRRYFRDLTCGFGPMGGQGGRYA